MPIVPRPCLQFSVSETVVGWSVGHQKTSKNSLLPWFIIFQPQSNSNLHSFFNVQHVSNLLEISRYKESQRSLMLCWQKFKEVSTYLQNISPSFTEHGIIKTDSVHNAMKQVDRKNYSKTKSDPYADSPQGIGE